MTVCGSLYRMWILHPMMLSVTMGTTGFSVSVQSTPYPHLLCRNRVAERLWKEV